MGGFESYLRLSLFVELSLNSKELFHVLKAMNRIRKSFAGLEYQIQRCADCFSGLQKSPWS